MKTIVLFTVLMMSSVWMANGYHDTMKKNIEKLEKSTSVGEINQLAALFTRIANAEPTKWLPDYYTAYAYVRSTHFMHNADSVSLALDKAQAILDKLLKEQADESEVYVLEAFVYSLRITSPMNGYKYSKMSNEYLEKAKQLDPNNPRVYYCLANNIYHTPKMFGGGATNALPLFEKAKELFNTVQPKNDLYPTWGSYHNEVMLQECLAEK